MSLVCQSLTLYEIDRLCHPFSAAAKYIWKIPTEEIPNFEKAKERAEAVFNVKVGRQDGGKVSGVEAEEVTSDRDIKSNVTLEESNEADIAGGRFGKL